MEQGQTNDVVLQQLYRQMERTTDALCLNRMDASWCKSKAEACEMVRKLIPQQAVVATGGSVTLQQCGIVDLLRGGDYQFLDRDAVAQEDRGALYRQAFSADVFLCSSNAITEHGELYNVDGTGNRVAALTFGPESVIIVAGCNKIVPNLKAAIQRVKRTAAPINAMRLGQDTPCGRCGICAGAEKDMTKGCTSEQRICASYVVTSWQRVQNRIKVILVAEPLGF